MIATAMDLVHTGPGTIAGRYLRRFWQPVYRGQDLAPGRAVPIQIMGERFTLYRGETGSPHLVDFRCAHRGTQLSVGWVEGDDIRCRYHGWRYDRTGRCVEQPGEDQGVSSTPSQPRPALSRAGIRSHPVQEYLGLIFCFLGEGGPPPLRRFETFEGSGVLDVGLPEYWPCNYFNRLDNACDIGHVAFAHQASIGRTNKAGEYAIPSLQFDESDYGIRTTVTRPGKPPSYFHFHMPNINQVRALSRVEGTLEDAQNMWVDELFWRVPVDDEHCVTFVVDYVALEGDAGRAYSERRRVTQESTLINPNETAEAILSGACKVEEIDQSLSLPKQFWIEDYVAQVGQGVTAPRAAERLGRMDAGVLLLRTLWDRELQALAEGKALKDWRASEPVRF